MIEVTRGKVSRRYSRRSLLKSAVLAGSGLLAAQVVGCGDGSKTKQLASPTATTPPASISESTATPTASAQPTLVPAPAAVRWTRHSPSGPPPPARRDHTMATDGETVFIFGGRGDRVLDDLWSFNATANSWKDLNDSMGPPARFGHNLVYDPLGNRLLVFGGQAGADFFNDLWAYDVNTGKWSELQVGDDRPAPRYGAASAFDPAGRFLISHGFTQSGRFDDTWAFGAADGMWSNVTPQGSLPVERCLMRGVWDPGANRFLMFGGQTTGTPFLNDIWRLDEEGWSELIGEPRPSARNFYAMAFDGDDGRLVLFGGRAAEGPLNDLWQFDSSSDTWSELQADGETPSPRSGHDAVWLTGRRSMMVFGGRGGSRDLNELWELSLSV